jgi:hypothetical protein
MVMMIMIIYKSFHNICSDKMAVPGKKMCSYSSTCISCKIKDRVFFPPLQRNLSDLKTRTIALVKKIDAPMLTRVGQELEYHIDVCRVTHRAHFEYF